MSAGATLVATGDPRLAAEGLLTAWDAGRIPVVVDPQWPPQVRAQVLAAAGQLPAAGPDRMVLLTSGSTGRPRAVLRTRASWTAGYAALERAVGLLADDVVWAPGRAGSTLTLFAAVHARLTGRRLLTSERGLPAGAAGARVLHAVPAVLPRLLEARAAGRLPRLRLAVLGGSHLPPGARAAAARAGIEVSAYYGAAELSFVALDTDGGGLRPFPGVQVRVRDGLVEARSPFLAERYLPLPADGRSTAGPVRPFRQDADGWAGVGDRGTLHHGVLRVLGRGDGVLDVGGHLVELAEVESVLGAVPGVAELACVGEPDPLLGSHVVALLRARPGQDPLPRLRAAARGLHRPARPVRWVLLDRVPLTPAGKPDRTELALMAGRDR